MRAGLITHCKGIAICHNEAHGKTLRSLLVDHVAADLSKKKELNKFAPVDMSERLNKNKPDRLTRYEKQTHNADTPAATATTKRRAALADTAAEDLAELLGETPAKKHKPTPKAAGVPAPAVGVSPPPAGAPPATPPVGISTVTPAVAPGVAPAKVEKPVEDLASLLKAFGGSNP
ncbi:hypothetical protein N9L68_07425 [bacterium]|nr:hypothetical protein [bacterium]